MAKSTQPTVLAAAADVLNDQLRVKLEEIAKRLRPRASQLEERFLEALQSGKDELPALDERQAAALRAITPGAALQTLGEGQPISEEFQVVERVKLLDNGMTLQIEYTMTDPKNWKGEWKSTKRWMRCTSRSRGRR